MAGKIEGFLRDKRLAFLAAWHPRAGNPVIRDCVGKDIARKIAREYITLKTQRITKQYPVKQPILCATQFSKFAYELGQPQNTPTTPMGLLIYHPKAVDRSLLYQDAVKIFYKSPTLSISYCQQDVAQPILVSIDEENSEHCKFLRAMLRVDEQMKTLLNTTNRFSGCIKMTNSKYPPAMQLKIPQKVLPLVFTSTREQIPLEHAISQGVIRRGTKVKIIFTLNNVWAAPRRTEAGLTMVARQFMIMESDCAFVSDDEG